jgi:hypothetical protein
MPDDSELSGEPDTTELPDCPSRPVLAVAAQDGIILLTDSGACFWVSRGKPLSLKPLPDLDGCSALAVDSTGILHAGLYDGMIAVPRDDEWSYCPADAAVLSLAASRWGLAIGDAVGSVAYRNPPGPAFAKVALGEAVVELAATDDGVVALGARGGLWRLGEPQGGTISSAPISVNEALGRPVGLFDTGNPSKVGVFSGERLALLSHGTRHLKVGIRRFPDGIDKVVRFGPKPGKTEDLPLGILTDAGQVWFVDADLKTVAPVLLPDESREVVGLALGPYGWLLAWTITGSLLAVSRDRTVRTLDTGDVTLAFADPDLPVRVAVVHWRPERGVRVRRLRLEPAR